MEIFYYSASTKGFYVSDVHVNIPDDAKEISKEYWKELLYKQSQGNEIHPDANGYPISINPFMIVENCIQMFKSRIQDELEKIAMSFGYSSFIDAISYASSSNKNLSDDANKLISFRDSILEWSNNKYHNVFSGMTWEEFSSDMPKIN